MNGFLKIFTNKFWLKLLSLALAIVVYIVVNNDIHRGMTNAKKNHGETKAPITQNAGKK